MDNTLHLQCWDSRCPLTAQDVPGMLPENSPTSIGSSAARRTCACMAGVTSATRSIRTTARRPTAPPLPWWRRTASKRSWTSPNRYRHRRTSRGRLECHRRPSSAGASCAARCAVVGGAWRRALLMVSGAILRSWRCSLRRIYTANDTTSVEISLISLILHSFTKVYEIQSPVI